MLLLRWISFSGRISLGRFWLAYVLPLIGLQLLALAVDLALFGWSGWSIRRGLVPSAEAAEGQAVFYVASFSGPVSAAWSWLSLVPGFAGMTRRWHDRGRSGWWSLLLLVPVIGWLWVFFSLFCRDGQRGPNRYGPDPLEAGPPEARG
ncbi:DUF805 domain-containing protein [Teichococcus rhizosphaerae]|uniref:DUF805 domain-containing protein n=1 Tax=Teichococcus rhizosphaerae TaxID=1335062 RepID=UPI001FE72ADD|nr:DUF805 domain-containing protein [Pseudoroseomonas rhizosphaerae]